MSSTDPARPAIRVAVVGAGLMGRWHVYFARRLGAAVAAVVDPEPSAARALARRAGGSAVFGDLARMLDQVRPHAVHVCTPLASHFGLVREAVAAGVHVLVEKPMTPLAEQTRSLLESAQAKSVHVCPVHQFAFQRGVSRAAEALAGLGEPLQATFTICSAGGGGSAGSALDGIVADVLPHPFSVLQALWPESPLRTQDWTASSMRHGELRAQGGAGNIPVDLRISMHARPTRCDLQILCSGGSIHLDFFHGFAVTRRGKPSRPDKISQPFLFAGKLFTIAAMNLAQRTLRRELAYPGLGNLIGRFYAAIGGAGDDPVSPRAALAVAVLREHLLRQALPDVLPPSGAGRATGREGRDELRTAGR